MRTLAAIEAFFKKPIFGCHMCGQCVLRDTGMTCPMDCPKTLRLGIPRRTERRRNEHRPAVTV